MNPQTITLKNTEIRILSTVKGLVSESKIVENEIDSFNPDLVVLGMGPEEVNGTREWDGEPYDMSGWDEIYGLSLRKIVGDKGVKLPPPSFSTAIASLYLLRLASGNICETLSWQLWLISSSSPTSVTPTSSPHK